MKKLIFILLAGALCITVNANGRLVKESVQQDDWQYKSFEADGLYGAGIDNAYRLLEGRKPAKTVTVALIGYGVDIDQKDLKDAIWTNPKEKLNGKDDDKNGFTDDIHGWNFLGTPDGKSLNRLSRVGDREFFRLKDKYARYIFVNDKYYTLDTLTQRPVVTAPPADRAEYGYFRYSVLPETPTGRSYMGIMFAKMVVSFVHDADSELRKKYPGKQLVKQDFETIYDGRSSDTLVNYLQGSVLLLFMSVQSDNWDVMVRYADTEYVQYQQQNYNRQLARILLDERKYIGDDPYDIDNKNYGNSNLKAANHGSGTMLAGIIGARRNNGAGIDGIAENVRIIPLRIDADVPGEPYMKDMANAIRYAVDKGADIIQLGKTNTMYPQPWSKWVDEALLYAEKKGTLVVIPMMDLSYDLDDQPFYPNRHLNGRELSNIITVAASDADGNPYGTVNFSNKELDLFAPGVDIQSIYVNGILNEDSGSELAAATLTGVTALIKSYYPEIAPEQMRKLLMDTVSPRWNEEVEKSFVMYVDGERGALVKDIFLFKDLCVSGGILNAEKALEEAAKRYGK